MKPLTIEINGTGTHNRGAELMAIAIAERMRSTFPGVRLVVSSRFGARADIHKHEFLVSWEFMDRGIGRLKTLLASMLWRCRRGVIDPAEVDIVLDASGFSFSDQWGPGGARRLVRMMSRSYRRKQVLVLLPQALGPFRYPAVADWSRRLFALAKLVCARDYHSHASVMELGRFPGLRQYPDFTVGVAPLLPDNLELPQKFCAIVPNYRMLDKTSGGQAYLDFLRHAIKLMRARALNLVFVLHDAKEDRKVLELLDEEARGIEILTHSDPRVLKGILGKADFVIGSRFHALVSSLSQGVPCIGAGWSHKYPGLFRDFSCSELLIADLADLSLLEAIVEELSAHDGRARISSSIMQAADIMKKNTILMWEEVETIIRHVRPIQETR